MAFIFADLIVLPILAVYRKYYGWAFAARISVLMLAAMILAALAVDGLFSLAGLIPAQRPTTEDVFGSIQVDYKLVLNVAATMVFAALLWLTVRRGVRDPVCGMTVDRARARSTVMPHTGSRTPRRTVSHRSAAKTIVAATLRTSL